MIREVLFGSKKISYDLRYSKRATFAVTVQGSRRVIVTSPLGMVPEDVDVRVRHRGAWILRQIRHSSGGDGSARKRRYVSGASQYLFGRELHLRVRTARELSVGLERPLLRVRTPDVSELAVEEVLRHWRVELARERFLSRIAKLAPRVIGRDAALPRARLALMRRRWGSCSRLGTISLNPWLSEHPIGCIDYVVLHELCHLKHLHHGPAFTNLLSRLLPDWRRWKRRLDESDRG
jgi:predicted metal-dependent hydrolase